MANSPSREAALQGMPYRLTRQERTPCVCDMLANLSQQGPRTPLSPGSAQSLSLAEAVTPLTVRTPTDWTGLIHGSS